MTWSPPGSLGRTLIGPGWAAIVPIYNLIVICQIAGKPLWYIALLFIPGVGGLIFGLLTGIGVAQSFGKSSGFGVGLALLGFIFYPILGFGSAQYISPGGGSGCTAGASHRSRSSASRS